MNVVVFVTVYENVIRYQVFIDNTVVPAAREVPVPVSILIVPSGKSLRARTSASAEVGTEKS